MNFCAGFRGHGAAGFLVETAGDGLAAIGADRDSAFTIGGAVVCRFHMAELVVLHRQVAVVLDDFGTVVFRQQVQVFLGVNVNLLLVSFVFKAQFVATLTLMGFGF